MSFSRNPLILAGIALVLVVIDQAQANSRIARQSVFPTGGPACPAGTTCIPLRTCPSLQALLQRPTFENLRRLQNALCGFNRRDPRVCCPASGPATPTPPTPTPVNPGSPTPPTPPPVQPPVGPPGAGNELPATCGAPAFSQTRIFFGETAPLGQYPWMALLGFSSFGSTNVVWGCGGALINSRYVVTAGHCASRQFTFNRQITVVRLGEYDISSNSDCQSTSGGQRCSDPHQDFAPEQVIVHPTFNTRGTVSDDIALIRLDRPVQFTSYIGPICLPAEGATVATLVGGRQASVAGWGTTENGPNTQILQHVSLPFVDRDTCNPSYNNSLIQEQVCFGGEGRRDSCFGDSGGPVMISEPNRPRYSIVGVVSFGQPQCGVAGVPAVYTDVTAYRSWIVSNLSP
ncbi:venom protease-like [Macrobrachium rosenbergii]|uniref:venom protease-like n=1 Tax=Macrobrachium rosenbergii TaxID=79674 RepID=UPI0034D5276D